MRFQITGMPSFFEACEATKEEELRECEFSLLREDGEEYSLDELYFKSVCTNWEAILEQILAQESLDYAKFFLCNVLCQYPFLEDHLFTIFRTILDKRELSSKEEERKNLEVKRRWKKTSLRFEINRITKEWEK